MMSGSPRESSGLVALRRRDTRRARPWTDRSAAAPRPGRSRAAWSMVPSSRTLYQTGNGTPKKRWRLTHQSPFRPLIQFSSARLHVGRVPLQLRGSLQQPIAELHRLDEPLPAGDDLQRPIALLVELDRVGDRPRLAGEIAALAQLLDDARAGLGGGEPGELVVVLLRAQPDRSTSQPALAPGHGPQRAVRLDDRADRQRQLAPPHHVGDVAERADHRDAGALLRIRERVRLHRHAHAEQRRDHLACRTAAGSARRPDGRPARRRPESTRAGWSRSRRSRRRRRARSGCDGRRPAARGPRARPAPPPCGSPRPRASALRADTPGRA